MISFYWFFGIIIYVLNYLKTACLFGARLKPDAIPNLCLASAHLRRDRLKDGDEKLSPEKCQNSRSQQMKRNNLKYSSNILKVIICLSNLI